MAVNIEMKMVPSQGKFAMRMSPAGQATGQMAMMGAMLNMQTVDDGKNMYTYSPLMQGYQKGPHNSKINLDPRKQFMQQAELSKFKYLRTEKLAGQDTHVIEMIMDMKKASEAAEKRTGRKMPVPIGQSPPMKAEMYVDVATSRFKQMVMHMDMGPMMGAMGGANAKPGTAPPSMKMDMTMAVKREVVNAPIPESAFKFTPPAGAKLLPGKPGTMGGMGMPGMGGGMGRPRSPR
jgi:outer membrane lipoprotein-sorting protein